MKKYLLLFLTLLAFPAHAAERLDLTGATQTLNETFPKPPVFRQGNIVIMEPGKPFTDPGFNWAAGYVWPHAAKGALAGQYWTSNAGTADVNPTGDMIKRLPAELNPFVWSGILNIAPQPLPQKYRDTVNNAADGPGTHISGTLNSYPYCQRYGVFSLFAMLPGTKGEWPAFWLLPKKMNWPPELDVLEMLSKDPRVIYFTVHSNKVKNGQSGNFYRSPTSLAGQWHEYTVDWGPKTTRFYLDRNLMWETPTPADMNDCMYILVNLAIGAPTSWSGAPAEKTYWYEWMRIKSIRVWQRPEYQ